MLIMINGDNKMNMKRDNVRIIRIISDLHCSLFTVHFVVDTILSYKLKSFVIFFKLLTCLLLSRPFLIKLNHLKF